MVENLKIKLLELLKDKLNRKNIGELIQIYEMATKRERELIRDRVNDEIASNLLRYSHISAVESVREKSQEKLLKGLIALSIEDTREDYRDNLIVLFLLYNSAKLIKVDFRLLIQDVMQLSSTKFKEYLQRFISRRDLDDDIVKLSGYKEVREPNFNYIWAGE